VRSIIVGDEATGRVLVGNRGLIFGAAEGGDWQLMCNEALRVTTSEWPDVVALPGGRLLAATSHGLLGSSDRGCSWQGVEPFGSVSAPALLQHPARPDTLYITLYGRGNSGVHASDDAGQHWQRILAVEDSDYLRYLRIAPGAPERLYVRKLSLVGRAFAYAVLRSSDGGQTWDSTPIEVADGETDFVLLGVSPSDPDLLVAKAEAVNPGAVPEPMYVSHDGGKTFASPIALRAIKAVEWSADGQTLWIGSDEGLFQSDASAQAFTRVGAAELVTSLKRQNAELLVAGYYRGGAAGISGIGSTASTREGGTTMVPWMGMTDVMRPLACEPGSPTGISCSALWADWAREILNPAAMSSSDAETSGPGTAEAADGGQAGQGGDAAAEGGGPGTLPPRNTDAADSGMVSPPDGAAQSSSSGCSIARATLSVNRESRVRSVSVAWLALLVAWFVRRVNRSRASRALPLMLRRLPAGSWLSNRRSRGAPSSRSRGSPGSARLLR
jgi:hypothetical protein